MAIPNQNTRRRAVGDAVAALCEFLHDTADEAIHVNVRQEDGHAVAAAMAGPRRLTVTVTVVVDDPDAAVDDHGPAPAPASAQADDADEPCLDCEQAKCACDDVGDLEDRLNRAMAVTP